MSAIRSNINITPYGGVVPVLKKIKELGIPQVIRSVLGVRKKQAKYGYEDIFIAWILTSLCGGLRLDHISKLKKKLDIIPNLKIPSHDTLGLVFKKLATETKVKRGITKIGKGQITYSEYNINEKLNEMLVKVTKRMGILTQGKKYTLHIDSTLIETNCFDAKYSYSTVNGFNPMICLIDDLPIYISMRNGNVAPQFEITKCLKDCLDLLDKHKIQIGTIISDSAGYNADFIKLINDRHINFLIRPKVNLKTERVQDALNNYSEWTRTEIRTSNSIWDCEVGDIPFSIHGSDIKYRLITTKAPRVETIKKNETDEERIDRENKEAKMNDLRERKLVKFSLVFGLYPPKGKPFEGYEYKFFLTNDHSITPKEVIESYHKRGGEERRFDWMKNDFGWALPSFMRMNQNTVFMIAAALANNVFRGVVKIFKKEIPQLRLTARLREFIYEFITVACSYMDGVYTFYSTDIAFEKIA